MNKPQIEWVNDQDSSLALIVRADFDPPQTTFVTPPEYVKQIGFIVYPSGAEIPRHFHKLSKRSLQTTPECLIVKKGKVEIIFYNHNRQEVCRRILYQGDLVLILNCGHQFKFLEDTVLIEVKQGPYAGPCEKELF